MERATHWVIPPLPDHAGHLSPPGQLTASYHRQVGLFHRGRQGEVFSAALDLAQPGAQVVLVTDLPATASAPAGWSEIPCVPGEGLRHHFDLRLHRPGAYHLRAKYTLDGGQHWYWDRAGYTRLLVDPEWQHNLRVYTLIPAVSGHLGDWRALLPHIRGLGCNVLQVLPLTAMDASASPYAARDLFALDPAYLDPSDPRDGLTQFGAFVEDVRAAGLRLCVDLVLNHAGIHSEPAQRRPDWFQPDPTEADGLRRAGWSDGHTWHPWRDLALFDFDHPHPQRRAELWDYVAHYALLWVGFAARTEGMLRLDNLHSSHEGLVRYVLGRVREQYPTVGILAELFSDPARTERLVWDYRLGLLQATPWEHRFLPQLRDYLRFLHGDQRRIHVYFPITSHDSGSPAQEFGHVGSTHPRYVVAALCGTGCTGLVQGVEYGVPQRVEFIGRWPKQDFSSTGHDYSDLIRRVNALMDRYPHFQLGGNLEFVDGGHEAVLAVLRRDPAGSAPPLLVVANFDTGREQWLHLQRHTLGLTQDALVITELLSASPPPVSEGHLLFRLAPCDVRVLQLGAS